ncbi:MAG: sortase [Eubacterium ramulus]
MAEAQTEADSSYENSLNIAGDGMMGIVEIPKIDIKLPIYHGTGDEVLQKAAGHLEGSSFNRWREHPCGYFCAPRIAECIPLPIWISWRLEIIFLIHVLDETLLLRGGQILVVDPEDTSALASRGW